MQRLRLSLITSLVLLIGSLALIGGGLAQSIDREKIARFVSFQSFLTNTRTAKFAAYRRLAGARVANAKAFEEMRSYILNYYEGVVIVSTFTTDGAFADCVTIESQPSLRRLGIKKLAPAPRSTAFKPISDRQVPGTVRYAPSLLQLGLKDQFGNRIACKSGTIPLQRITLERLVRFPTLRDFLSKTPNFHPGKQGRNDFKPDWEATHLHAHAWQFIDNFGGNSWLNLWNPSGDFTLSQQWYVADAPSGTQTAEGGWVNEPDRWGNSSVLFIYWTADGYNNTGCYNLDCAGFVQINSNWYLGGPWNHYSTFGGDQWGFELQWKLYQGNWWLFLKGPGDYEAVGYYPTSIYGAGGLANKATRVDYGGEVARKTGDAWPQMGSGRLAATGWQQAAFQEDIFYIPHDENDGFGVWTDLAPQDEGLPACFTVDFTPASAGGSWGSYIFFGGPGGMTCN